MRIVRVAERWEGGSRAPRGAFGFLLLSPTRARGVAARGLFAALAPALMLAGCAPVPQSPAPPPRTGIVSLNPCADAILAEVADPGQIRGLSAYSSDPAASSMDVARARRYPAVTGTVEEIAALRPALVISSTFTPPATRAALARLGIPLAEVGIATDVPESLAQVRRIAALAGRPDRGEALVGRIEAALAAARPATGRAHASALAALVWQSGGIVPGDRSLIADLLRRTGFANAAAARGLGQADYLPLERVLADPPAVILTAGGRHGEDRLLHHPALGGLRGTTRAALDPALLWCGGPTIIRAAARLAEIRGTVRLRAARSGEGPVS